jgi:hypothetical protein
MAPSAFYREEEPQRERQHGGQAQQLQKQAELEIGRIRALKNPSQLAGYLLAKKGTPPDLRADVQKALAEKLAELEGAQGKTAKTVAALVKNGAGILESARLLAPLCNMFDVIAENSKLLTREYQNADGAGKEAILEDFSGMVVGGRGDWTALFLENDAALSFCRAAARGSPHVLQAILESPKTRFADFDGKKIDIVDVLFENFKIGGENRSVGLAALGRVLESRQDQKAKDGMLSIFRSIDAEKEPQMAAEVLVALKPFMERFGNLAEFTAAVGTLLASAPEKIQIDFLGAFFNGGFQGEVFRKMSGPLIELAFGKAESLQDGMLKDVYRNFMLDALVYGEISERQRQMVVGYFTNFINEAEKLPLEGEYLELRDFFGKLARSKDIVRENEGALLRFAMEMACHPEKIAEKSGLGRFYSALQGILFDRPKDVITITGMMPIFSREKLTDLAEKALETIGSSRAAVQLLQDSKTELYAEYNELVASFYAALAVEYRKDETNGLAKLDRLTEMILDSGLRHTIANCNQLEAVTDGRSSYGRGDAFFSAMAKGLGREKGYPKNAADALYRYLGKYDAAQDGELYFILLGAAKLNLEVNGRDVKRLENAGLFEHIFNQFQNETNAERKEALLGVLLISPSTLPRLSNIVFADGMDKNLKAGVLAAFGKSKLQMENDSRLYRMLGEAKTAPAIRQEILNYVKAVKGGAEAENVALSLFRNESLDYIDRLRSIPDAENAYVDGIFPKNRFDLLAFEYCLAKMTEPAISQKDYFIFAQDATLRLHNIGLAALVADYPDASPDSKAAVQKTGIAAAPLKKEYLELLRADFFASKQKREVIQGSVSAYGLFEELSQYDEKFIYVSQQYKHAPLLHQIAPYYKADAVSEFAGILQKIHGENISIDNNTVGFLLEMTGIFPESTARIEGLDETNGNRQLALSLLGKIFSAGWLPGHYAPESAGKAQEHLTNYLWTVAEKRIQMVEDPYDPIKGTMKEALAPEETQRLLGELAIVGKRIAAGESVSGWAPYVTKIAEVLTSKAVDFSIGKNEEPALLGTLRASITAQNYLPLEALANTAMSHTEDKKGAGGRVREVVLEGIGTGTAGFEKERMRFLAGKQFNTPEVNKALRAVANDSIKVSEIRSAAIAALGEHGKTVDGELYDDDSFSVRAAALGEPLTNAIKNNTEQGLEAAKKALDKRTEPSGVLGGIASGSTGRAADEDNLGRITKVQKSAVMQGDWSTDREEMAHLFARVEAPIIAEFSSPKKGDLQDGSLTPYNYSGSFKIKQKKEKGYAQIAGKEACANYLKGMVDIGMPRFLANMGLDETSIETLMRELAGLEINYVSSSSKIGGYDALGRTDFGDPNRISLDVDAIQKEAKRSGLNDRFALYDVTLHEVFHLMEASLLMKKGRHQTSDLHTYLINGRTPLDEPITEVLTTFFELQHTASKANAALDAHAQNIGVDFVGVVKKLDNGYQQITKADWFIDWVKKITPTKLFRFYITGDLEGLKKATDDAYGPGEFERIFPNQ